MILRSLMAMAAPEEARGMVEGGWSLTNDGLVAVFGGGTTLAGVSVTPESALTYAAIYAVITVLAQDVATMPLVTYRKSPEGKRSEAEDLPIYWALLAEANPEMSAFVFRETMMGYLLSRGNAYAEIQLDGRGRPFRLWPIHPARVAVERRADRSLVYFVDGSRVAVPSSRILHIRAFGNGDLGLSPIDLHRQGIGIGIAADASAASLLGNNSVPGGLLKLKGRLKQEGKDRLRKDWQELHGGGGKRGGVAVLEDGTDFQAISFSPEASQFLESRKFQVEEVCRIYRVPPHKVASLERATFSNIEQQSLEYLQTSLAHWLVRWEQEINRKLLSIHSRTELYCEHRVDALLRSDTQQRYAAYTQARTAGWLTRNEIRAKENMDPLDGKTGNDPDAPLNSNRGGGSGSTPGGEPKPGEPQDPNDPAKADAAAAAA